jgi:hypothetical protein
MASSARFGTADPDAGMQTCALAMEELTMVLQMERGGGAQERTGELLAHLLRVSLPEGASLYRGIGAGLPLPQGTRATAKGRDQAGGQP